MSQTLLTVFEDRQKKLTLTSRQYDDILSFRSVLGENRLSLSYDGYLHVRHYIGFISKGKTRLQILPKVYENTGLDDESQRHESMRAMLNLLRVSEFNKILGLPDQSSIAEKDDIMEVLISIFAAKVFDTYSRQMNREYIDISENSQYIKGKIDFIRNLRLNPIRKDRHIINYQSFEHDNLINNVIKTICLRLLRLTQMPENKKALKKALVFLDDAIDIPLSKDIIDSAKFTRLNMPFKPVYEMAKMFFYNNMPEGYQGDDTVCSFLIPLNELFEYYLYKVTINIDTSYKVEYHNRKRFVVNENGKTFMHLCPDISICKNNEIICIVDAKYKNPKYESGSYININQADVYQVFAYARVYGARQVALIYPQFDKINPPAIRQRMEDTDGDIELVIACLDIRTVDLEHGVSQLREALFL